MTERAKDGSRRGRGTPWPREKTALLTKWMAEPNFDIRTAALALNQTADRVRDKIKQMNRRRPANLPERTAACLAASSDPYPVYEAPLEDFLPGRTRKIEREWANLLAGARFT